MNGEAIRGLARVLQFGTPETRRRLAERLLEDGDGDCWPLLAGTVCSGEPWLLRARSLEVLGLAVARADRRTAEMILDALRDLGGREGR